MPANHFKISALPCLRLSRIGSLTFAKNGERDPARLYEQALKVFAIDDTSMLFVGVGDHPLPAFVAESSVALPPVEGVHHDQS